tara:strand:+ start:970 stop:1659 length:690 start_codon:yes stop_codon:yes gene_type:complete
LAVPSRRAQRERVTRLVCLDVDSTLLSVESLDFAIASTSGPGAAQRVEAITHAGMNGTMDLRTSLAARLDLAKFSRSDVARAAVALKDKAVPGMAELLADLRGRGDQVVAISGGFDALLRLALRDLGFSPVAIRTNTFVWSGDRVSGFETGNPLSENGGKALVVREFRRLTGVDTAVMVGDGITDVEAFEAGATERFIGFGGVVRRDAVAARAPEFAANLDALRAALLD